MNYYLDTDICIFVLKGKFPSIKSWMQSFSPERIKIPSIVKAELLLGARKSEHPKQVTAIVEAFLAPFEVIPFCDKCTVLYSEIRWDLERRGQTIGPNDLLIAATVVANEGVLITHNTQEYSRIPRLKIQDWVKSAQY